MRSLFFILTYVVRLERLFELAARDENVHPTNCANDIFEEGCKLVERSRLNGWWILV